MNETNFITINTDASFHPLCNLGGYAFYIICDHFKVMKSGAFKGVLKDPHDAEIKCIANALHSLLSQPEIPRVNNKIIINTDSMDCIKKLGGVNRKKYPVHHLAIEMTRKLSKRKDGSYVKFEYRHVKAHEEVKDARGWVNQWCDREAKKWMRKSVKEFTGTSSYKEANRILLRK